MRLTNWIPSWLSAAVCAAIRPTRIGCAASVMVLVACVSAPASAQEFQPTTDQAFGVLSTHDGLYTQGYRLLVNDSAVGPVVPVSARADGAIRLNVPNGLPKGSHSIQVEAIGASASTRSPVKTLVIDDPAPNAPGMPMITVTTTAVAKIQVQPDGQPMIVALDATTTAVRSEP